MKFKYLALLVALLPLITFAVVNAQPQLPDTSSDGARYTNTQWHFSLVVPADWHASAFDAPGNETIQFLDAAGNYQFQVGAWRLYEDLDVALGEEGAPGASANQGDTLGIVHVFHNDIFEVTFVKNGISYVVQSLPENATSTLDILRS